MDQEQTMRDILDVVTYIKDNVPMRDEVLTKDETASKQDLTDLKADLETRMASKQDLADLKVDLESKMATKDDLKGFASKDDLKRFATKDDLKRFATKDDLALLERKVDSIESRMATKRDLHEIKDEMISHVDGFIKLHNKHEHEISALRNGYNRLNEQINGGSTISI